LTSGVAVPFSFAAVSSPTAEAHCRRTHLNFGLHHPPDRSIE
jgi:hypothetical protein